MKYSLGQYDYNGEAVSSWMTSSLLQDAKLTDIRIAIKAIPKKYNFFITSHLN